MKTALEKNREYSDDYIQKIKNSKIPNMIKPLIEKQNVSKIVDLGCGEGGIICAIEKQDKSKKITGVDISPRRIDFLKNKFLKYNFLCKDVCSTRLKKHSFDLVISTQVIEHVEDDKKLVDEIDRILKYGGYLYISSVVKKFWAIYKYRNRHGKLVLDPTHEKEYSSKEEFINLFKNKFSLLKLRIVPVRFKKIFLIRIPGYYIVESLWKK